MQDYLTIEATRDGYSPEQCRGTMTVCELIAELSQWDDDLPVYLSHDKGYTFSRISSHRFTRHDGD
jgi:hypothetical protein